MHFPTVTLRTRSARLRGAVFDPNEWRRLVPEQHIWVQPDNAASSSSRSFPPPRSLDAERWISFAGSLRGRDEDIQPRARWVRASSCEGSSCETAAPRQATTRTSRRCFGWRCGRISHTSRSRPRDTPEPANIMTAEIPPPARATTSEVGSTGWPGSVRRCQTRHRNPTLGIHQ